MSQEKKKQTFMDAFVISYKEKKQQRESSAIWHKEEEEIQVSPGSSSHMTTNNEEENMKDERNDENISLGVVENKMTDQIDLEAAEEQAISEAKQTVFPDLDGSQNNPDTVENVTEGHVSTGERNITNTNPFDEENDEEKALVVYQTSSLQDAAEEEEEKDTDEIVVWNEAPSNSIPNTSPKHNVRTAMIPFQKKYSDFANNSKNDEKKTRFEISIPRTKAPWVGLIASGLILIASLLLKDEIIKTKLATYGYVLASVGIVGGILQLILSSENGIALYINYFLFLWCFVGACIMTFKPGHFVETGNGYFASWGMVIFVAMGADPPGESSMTRNLLDNLNSTMNLGAVSVLFIASLATEFHHGIDQYKGEAVYAICVAVISVVLVMLFSVWKYTKSNVTVSIWEALIWVLVAVAWVIAAVIVTFRGPFDTMGNGYFSSWIGASIAFSTSTSAWKARSRDVPV